MRGWLTTAVAGLVLGSGLLAAPAGNPPLPPVPPSPVGFFRELLAASPAERARRLADRPEAQRQALEAKLHEYDALPPADRDLRLRATEFHWYFRLLLPLTPTNRPLQLAAIPEDYRTLVGERLVLWDRLPETARRDLLEYQSMLSWLRRNPAAARQDLPPLPPGRVSQLEEQLTRWKALPDSHRDRMFKQFETFFELSPTQRERTLADFPKAERVRMEETLQAFARMAPEQRRTCLLAFERFARMSAADRADFLRSADRWREMSPAERESWRRLVTRVADLPPLPPLVGLPPLPPGLPPPSSP